VFMSFLRKRNKDIAAYLLRARTAEPLLANGSETKFVSRQWLGKYVPAATDTQETIEVLLETVFSTRPVQGGYKEDNWGARVEAGSNTSTVTLRVVGTDEKGSLKSETVKYGRESQGTRTQE
jgi:hypothetical protein